MVTATDILDALSKSAAYDNQHAPKPGTILVNAWLEHFTRYAPTVTRDDLLEAVTEHHREPHDRILQPADLSAPARLIRRDRYARSDTDSPQRLAVQARIDAKTEPAPQPPANRLAEHQARLARVIAMFNTHDPDDTAAPATLNTLADSPLRVACPWCKATPGNPCTIPGTFPPLQLQRVRAHPARLAAVSR